MISSFTFLLTLTIAFILISTQDRLMTKEEMPEYLRNSEQLVG